MSSLAAFASRNLLVVVALDGDTALLTLAAPAVLAMTWGHQELRQVPDEIPRLALAIEEMTDLGCPVDQWGWDRIAEVLAKRVVTLGVTPEIDPAFWPGAVKRISKPLASV